MAKTLTAAGVAKLLPGKKRLEVADAGCPGLRLIIQVSGSKSWALRFRRPDGRSAKLTLGSFDPSGELDGEPVIGGPLTLAAARKLASDVGRQRAMGKDVIADQKAAKRRRRVEREERTASTFPLLARQFIEEHAKKTRTWRLSARLLGLAPDTLEAIPKGLADRWGDKPVSEITADDIHDLIDEVQRRGVPGWKRRNGGDSVAWVAHARIAKFFSWLVERRVITANPCLAVRRPDASAPRDRVLSDDEIKWFWQACGGLSEPFGPLLKLLLLLGQRRAEVAGMTRGELSADRGIWSIPGGRTKNKRPHVVPLSKAARDLIASVRAVGTVYVFTTNGTTPVSGWSKVKNRLDEKMLELAVKEKAVIPGWTIHDLRRTAAAGFQRLGVPIPVTERILNHVSGSFAGVVGVYQRHEYKQERREALERWSDLVQKLVSGEAAKG